MTDMPHAKQDIKGGLQETYDSDGTNVSGEPAEEGVMPGVRS